MRAAWMALAVGLLVPGTAPAGAKVDEAMSRPALMLRQPQGAVLLAAATAGARLVAVGERGVVVFSDDGGHAWRQADVPVSVTLTAIAFADDKHGMAVGHGGVALSTTDGGASWRRTLDGNQLAAIALASARESGQAAAIKEAERLVAEGPDKPLLDIVLLDGHRALAVGAYGLAVTTEDGGRSWTSWSGRMDNPRGLHLYAARVRGGRIVIAGEQGLLLRSTDGGTRFHRLSVPYSGSFFSIELPADGEIVVGGLRGNIWRSVDEGATWTKVETPAPVSVVGSTRAAGRTLFINQAGVVLDVSQGQARPAGHAPAGVLNGIVATGKGELIGLGPGGITTIDRSPAGGR